MHDNDSSFVSKEPCPECGSKDNLARYSDGHGYCFGCQHYEPPDEINGDRVTEQIVRNNAHELIDEGVAVPIPARGLTKETCEFWGYGVTAFNGGAVQVANYRVNGVVVAQKVRWPNKDFRFFGDTKEAGLYGQHLWRNESKRIVITEGEIDALSVSQVQGNKWPVVSVPNGAQGAKKALSLQLQWLIKFDEIVIMFDNDEPGVQAAQECALIFPPGKCKIAKLHPKYKDASDALKVGDVAAIMEAIFGAKAFRPDGILTIADLMDATMMDPEMGYSWFLPTLDGLTFGRRLCELYGFGAGTGVGKSDFFAQQIMHDMTILNQPVAAFMLEQGPAESLKRIAGKQAGKTFHVPDGSWSKEELFETLTTLKESSKLFLYDSFGATDWEIIKSTIRFLAHSEGIKLFYLDHLTALAAAEDDERTALERILSEMSSLCKELKIIIHYISHLATPDGTPHEEGGRVMIRHFKGARAIGFWTHFMFGLERNQQDEDPALQQVTTFRILKDRYTGRATGKVIHLGYDSSRGMLSELGYDPYAEKDDNNANPFANTNDVGGF
jgi:twinkle protein